MIKIVFKQEGNKLTLTMKGHAGYSDAGNDIVCAGASAIAYTLLGYLVEVCGDNLVYKDYSGDLSASCPIVNAKVTVAFGMAQIGFLQLEKAYPSHVRVEKFQKSRKMGTT